MQGVVIPCSPRDIDLFADADSVVILHEALSQWGVDEQILNTSGLYTSTLSHYSINKAQIELVGNFMIASNSFQYKVEVEDMLRRGAPEIELEGVRLSLTPLSHELIFNVLRQRADRYEAIATTMRDELRNHIPLLEQLISKNNLSDAQIELIATLLGAPTVLSYMSTEGYKRIER
ncbi:hypothetical protein [Paenibacillus sp. CMAA1364]